MRRFIPHIISISAFVLGASLVGGASVQSDSLQIRDGRQVLIDHTYRSETPFRKVVVTAREQELKRVIMSNGGSVIAEYASFSLLSAPGPIADAIPGPAVRDDMNVLLLKAGLFDTTQAEPEVPDDLLEPQSLSPEEKQLYLVQMVGPVKPEWVDSLSSTVEIIGYIPNNAYLVRCEPAAFNQLKPADSPAKNFIQWSGLYRPAYKIAPEIQLESDAQMEVAVQLVNGGDGPGELSLVATYADSLIGEAVNIDSYTNLRVRISARRIPDLARLSSVVWIEPWTEPSLFDERQDQIVAGNFSGSQIQAPGYLAWLRSKGLASTPDFVVDLSDSGLDLGFTSPSLLHRDFLDQAGNSRVAYARFLDTSGSTGVPNDQTGHGTLNASIVGGYNESAGFPNTDSEGYSFGLGVHPFVRMGNTKIFNPDFTNPNLASMVDLMYGSGARVSSNSWGSETNTYTLNSQTYDRLTRDAQAGVPGNQELCIIFAAGNKGLNGHMAAPANAKNVIAVGASENLRPTGTDGCSISSQGADDAHSIISFSGGGPVADGRTKPDIIAPGTHIQGAQSQDPGYTGRGVCGPKSFPAGQSLYTWSSGTSHAAPAVAGAAALVRQYFQSKLGRVPSPAMTKAFLTNSTTYMTGNFAADTLPSNNQGWGLLNLGRALDNTPRVLVDQDRLLTSSGQTFTIRGRVADASKPLRITLAWTDAPGTSSANPVVNDLDLEVELGSRFFRGNSFSGSVTLDGGFPDKRNNVESVWLPEGTSGEFSVRVVGANIPGDGVPNNGTFPDQDFALVIYNGVDLDGTGGGGGGGGGGGSIDQPPTVKLLFPLGGERLVAGSVALIRWDSSDDKGIQNHWVELSTDGGATFRPIAILDGRARQFNWLVPNTPTTRARIQIRVLDGVNFAVASASPADFEITTGPPDLTPPQATVIAPVPGAVLAAGSTTEIKWSESDNVGVIRRVIDFSTDGGDTFRELADLVAASGPDPQSFTWQVPSDASSNRARLRLTVFDGSNNRAEASVAGKFHIWQPPRITGAEFNVLADGRNELGVIGGNFHGGETEIYVNGILLKKIKVFAVDEQSDGSFSRVYSYDKKLHKRVPAGTPVQIVVKLPRTGQESQPFQFKRKGS